MRSRLRRVRTPVLIGTGLVRILRSGLCRTAELVTSRELPLAQTVIGSLYSAGLLVGAGLGGVVTATWGTSATLLIDGASFVVSALLVAKIKRVGALYLAQGLGAVLGPFVGRRLTGGSTHRRLYVAAAALAIFGLGYLLLAHSTHLGPGMAAALVGHIGVGACAILALNGLQLTTPDHIRGRVMVFVFSLSSALQGVSTLAVAHPWPRPSG
ncbi:hypothetical protein AB0C28_29900 [Nonomuraea sp. NPDC048892]|uniref:hypothetical protein n=1 Tax=Nonomuraea sp. NPDC048892 TaxID=3154624 RepID=UPI0033EDC822